jgi:predicted LPLAT superfamily acyltransferase
MKQSFYRFLIFLTKILGPWIFVLLGRGLATFFFLLFPKRTAVSVRFYRALFPDRNRIFHLLCALRQYHRFTNVFLDRYLLRDTGVISFTEEGWHHFERALDQKTGGIILMSHLGNWEVAAHLMKRLRPDIRLLLYMGAKEKEEIEGLQKKGMVENGIAVIASEPDRTSPFDFIPALNFLREGGFVSLSGDRIWTNHQQVVGARFLERSIRLPKSPYVLALASGAPLFIFFSFRTGPKSYHFWASEPIRLEAVERHQREEFIQRAAQNYADILEDQLRRHPFDWFHFEAFLL